MNKTELQQYRHLSHEIDMIQEQINTLQYDRDIVLASDRDFPYLQHTKMIGGHPGQDDQIKRRRLEQRKAVCQRELEQIENFVYQVEDSLIRQLLTYRYLQGLKWNEIAGKMGCGYTVDGLRMTLERFLKKS